MTEQEAIKSLKDILKEVTSCEDAVCYVTSNDEDVLKKSIEALEKQIPKKPVSIEPPFMGFMKCPSCGESFDCDEEYYLKYGKRHCCANCGQRIEWGD